MGPNDVWIACLIGLGVVWTCLVTIAAPILIAEYWYAPRYEARAMQRSHAQYKHEAQASESVGLASSLSTSNPTRQPCNTSPTT